METPKVAADASLREVAELMLNTGSRVVEVDTEAGEPGGWIEALDLVKGLLRGNPDLKARDICRPVEPSDFLQEDISGEELAQWYITRGRILPYFISQKEGTGKQLLPYEKEVEMALAIMMPDLRLTRRLQSIVEYRDEYDSSAGKICITGRITQGVYRHVINILKLVADVFQQGLMDLPGIEKDILVTAAIFHDLGKVQPELKIGDVVDPREVFEPGYKHAFRGAALAEGVYGLNRDTVLLIKYHHHEEGELPSEFPEYLLPMYRLFRLLDGLSAGITRRGARVRISVQGTKIFVEENNPVPKYDGAYAFDLYMGGEKV